MTAMVVIDDTSYFREKALRRELYACGLPLEASADRRAAVLAIVQARRAELSRGEAQISRLARGL